MYDFEWHLKSRAYKLLTKTGKFVASEIRPVYAQELILLGADKFLEFDHAEKRPLLWGKHNAYIYKGKEIAKITRDENDVYSVVPSEPKKHIKIEPVDIELWLSINSKIMDTLVADTLKRIKEMYDAYKDKTDVCYIGFSGGKDSMVLLDLCHKVLPLTVPVVYSDTDMELPDSYKTWDAVKRRYDGRPFMMVKSPVPAIKNWESFGPPSQNLRWCCAVHKSTPAIIYLRELAKTPSARTLAYVGVRSDESIRRSSYDDIGDGLKSQSQVNAMPILNWGAPELFLYTYAQDLIVNDAYRKGLPRVGCLLCPMSTERQVDVIRKIYPKEVSLYSESIRSTITREFSSEKDFTDFIYKDKGWHARQSGVTLKNVIQSPSMERKDGRYLFSFSPVQKEALIEWMKTIGTVSSPNAEGKWSLATNKENIEFNFRYRDKDVIGIEFYPVSGKIDKATQKYTRSAICKTLGCVGCRACETECPTGALTITKCVHVDSTKCIHCMRCHATNDGCMRYFSLRYAGGTTMNISGINKYMTFGLKEEWVNILVQDRENFRSTTELGNRMIPSAVTWFREASLIAETTAITPTKLLEIATTNGADESNDQLWSMIWFSLANKSPLIKWFVCSTEFGQKYTADELNEKLHQSVASESVRKGALQSLFQTLKNSPLGNGSLPVSNIEVKGSRVLNITRMPKSIDPYALLFSLYLMGKLADRTAFTVSEMLSADFDSPFISPLVAFGMNVDEFKAQCLGISSARPDYLSCSFTLGLDEIRMFPNEKSIDDVLGMILGE
jgi:phosphoadenosine phosphosulfate reductase